MSGLPLWQQRQPPLPCAYCEAAADVVCDTRNSTTEVCGRACCPAHSAAVTGFPNVHRCRGHQRAVFGVEAPMRVPDVVTP